MTLMYCHKKDEVNAMINLLLCLRQFIATTKNVIYISQQIIKMMAIGPTYCNKMSSVAMRLMAACKFLSSVLCQRLMGQKPTLECLSVRCALVRVATSYHARPFGSTSSQGPGHGACPTLESSRA
jgi:hypothetical protein